MFLNIKLLLSTVIDEWPGLIVHLGVGLSSYRLRQKGTYENIECCAKRRVIKFNIF